jgi:ABC-type sulfate/molybdate transport systems ATPase subunit
MGALSGGQMQRALLAQAIAGRPQVLVLDEPTQGLDQPGIAAFYRLIEDLRRELGCAVLSVSHDLHVVMSASDRVICLNGHVCCEGTPEVVSNAPEYRALFGLGTGGALALYRTRMTMIMTITTITMIITPTPRKGHAMLDDFLSAPRWRVFLWRWLQGRWAVSWCGGAWPISAMQPRMPPFWAWRWR